MYIQHWIVFKMIIMIIINCFWYDETKLSDILSVLRAENDVYGKMRNKCEKQNTLTMIMVQLIKWNQLYQRKTLSLCPNNFIESKTLSTEIFIS